MLRQLDARSAAQNGSSASNLYAGIDLISDALPFGRLWYGEPNAMSNAIGYAKHCSRSHDAVIRVYDEAGSMIQTHGHKGEFKEPPRLLSLGLRKMLCTAGHDPSGLIKTIPMEPGEALGLAAQIAVGLAGFAGVVVVFRRGSLHELSPIDKYRLWLLLANSAVPLLCCLFAILLLTVKPAPISIWRWCSAFSTLLLSPLVYMSRRTTAKLGPNAIRNIGGYRYVYYGMAIVGTQSLPLTLRRDFG